jgi:hypothetical protein
MVCSAARAGYSRLQFIKMRGQILQKGLKKTLLDAYNKVDIPGPACCLWQPSCTKRRP